MTPFSTISPSDAHALIHSESPLLLDVRSPGEFQTGHLHGARLVPLQALEAELSSLAAHKEKPVVVYCHAGTRSAAASQLLVANGFTKVYNVESGITGWRAANLPIE